MRGREKGFDQIAPGDEVTLLVWDGRTPTGPRYRTRVGRAVRLTRKGWLVRLTRMGRPYLVDEENFVEAATK